jgi:hypothetical protein
MIFWNCQGLLDFEDGVDAMKHVIECMHIQWHVSWLVLFISEVQFTILSVSLHKHLICLMLVSFPFLDQVLIYCFVADSRTRHLYGHSRDNKHRQI